MPDELEIGSGKVLFQDGFIVITIPSFDSHSGVGQVLIEHKQEPVGNYYIWVYFKSGDSTRLDYNGANPNNPKPWIVNSSHRNDTILRVEAKKIG